MKNNLNIKLDDSTNSSTSDSAKPAADIWKEYYENGQIKEETLYVDGELIDTINYDDKNVKIS